MPTAPARQDLTEPQRSGEPRTEQELAEFERELDEIDRILDELDADLARD